MADIVVRCRHDVRFALYGADEGEGSAVQKEIVRRNLESSVSYGGPVPPSAVPEILASAQAFVLPSVDEPFPMALLEAMSYGLPSVVTDQTGISDELASRASAVVTDGSPQQMADAILRVLGTQTEWRAWSERASRDVHDNFSVEAVTATLVARYTAAITPGCDT